MTSIANTSVALPDWHRIYVFGRRNLERVAAVATVAILLWWRPEISAGFTTGGWKLEAFYSAVFNWAAVQGAFLFGVYAFFLSRSEPFVQAISEHVVFRQLRQYVVRALYLTLTLSVGSLPLLVHSPPFAGGATDWAYAAFLGISALLAYTFFCFLKVIRVFGKIERAGE